MNSKRPRGRPPRIERDDIVDAALRIGLDRLSMRAVARELGVGASTLYYHVESLDELRSLVGERLLERFALQLGDPKAWEATIERGARALRAAFAHAPGLAETALHDPLWGDAITALNERACAYLVDAGFSTDNAWLAVRAIADMVEAHAVRRQAHARAGRSDLDNVDGALAPTPVMREARERLGASASDRRFDLALRCLIVGLRDVRSPRRR